MCPVNGLNGATKTILTKTNSGVLGCSHPSSLFMHACSLHDMLCPLILRFWGPSASVPETDSFFAQYRKQLHTCCCRIIIKQQSRHNSTPCRQTAASAPTIVSSTTTPSPSARVGSISTAHNGMIQRRMHACTNHPYAVCRRRPLAAPSAARPPCRRRRRV